MTSICTAAYTKLCAPANDIRDETIFSSAFLLVFCVVCRNADKFNNGRILFEKPNMEQRVQRMNGDIFALIKNSFRFVLYISCEIVELCFSALPKHSTLLTRSHLADFANASRKESQHTMFSLNSFRFSQSLVDIEAAAATATAAVELLVSVAFFSC